MPTKFFVCGHTKADSCTQDHNEIGRMQFMPCCTECKYCKQYVRTEILLEDGTLIEKPSGKSRPVKKERRFPSEKEILRQAEKNFKAVFP